MTTKVCSKCKVEKDVGEFYKNRARKDGRQAECVSCISTRRALPKEKAKEKAARDARRANGPPAHIHGTTTGYWNWGCRCSSCTQAVLDYVEKKRQETSATKIPHGASGGYTNYACRCRNCKSAWAAAVQKRKLERRAETPPTSVHGTPGGYWNWGCRCSRCKRARAVASRGAQSRRRARKLMSPPGDPTLLKSRLKEIYESPCARCGTTENINADHIIPLDKGGFNAAFNLQPLCGSCNSRKGARLTPLLCAKN